MTKRLPLDPARLARNDSGLLLEALEAVELGLEQAA